MKIDFEVYRIPSSGVPRLVKQSDELKNAVSSALHLITAEPGCYFVCTVPNAYSPILELSDVDAIEDVGERSAQNKIQNQAYELYPNRGEEFSSKDYGFAAEKSYGGGKNGSRE